MHRYINVEQGLFVMAVYFVCQEMHI